MAYYVNVDDRTLAGAGDVQPSSSLSFAGAIGSAITGNFSSVLTDYAELQQANQGQRMQKTQADAAFKAAGIKHSAPDAGYTQKAIDLIIQRQSNDMLRKRVDEATPWSWLDSPVRGGAMLLAGVADPLNVASAFIPVVGEARAASMLAKAGESGFSRFTTRAAIGAAEGAVGAAVLEVPTYALRTALQDDYHLTDSLLNMAFGTIAGGGLHAVGGAVGDAFRGGANPHARFAGLTVPEVRQVLNFEAGKAADVAAFTPAMRKAAGLAGADVPIAAAEQAIIARAPQSELARVADAPFAKLYETTPEGATRTALGNIRDDLRAELLAQTSGRADAGIIAAQKRADIALSERRETLSSDAEFKRRAKQAQASGLSRKQAESEARKQIAAELADVSAQEQRSARITENNRAAAQAEQDLAAIDRGEIPAQFADRVKVEADKIAGAAEIARAISGEKQPPAAFVVGMASPETREVSMRTALAHMADGRLPDVNAILGTDPGTIGPRATARDVAATAERQNGPDAAYMGDPASADAATKRAADAPKSADETTASSELTEATQRLAKLQQNLEDAGVSRESLERITNLAAFDEGIKGASALGKAIEAAAICGIRQ